MRNYEGQQLKMCAEVGKTLDTNRTSNARVAHIASQQPESLQSSASKNDSFIITPDDRMLITGARWLHRNLRRSESPGAWVS